MKAIFLLSLVASALAASADLPLASQYATVASPATGVCNLAPGYVLYALSAAPTTTVTASTVATTTVYSLTTTGQSLTATTCAINLVSSATTTYFVFGCAANYTSSGAGSTTNQTFGTNNAGTAWDTTVAAITGFTGPYNFGTSTTFQCIPNIPPACNYTCTTSGSGSGCNATGTVAVGTLPQALCYPGYFATVTSPTTATTSCPAGGLGTTAWVVVCSNSITAYTTTAQWFLIASAQRGWSEPKSCNCAKDPVCPSKNSWSPSCSRCNLSPCVQTNAGPLGTMGGVRANTFAAAAFCPAAATTLAAMQNCFEQAACGGAIASGDVCIYGVANQAGTAPCPTCPSGSKKGLLGLLGLLGLIPLLLCSSLLCLLLFCIRRNKKERDVHFATFDAGAPAVVAPVCHDFPVAHQTQTVHHATYVGPQHCAVPSGFGY